MGFAIELRHGSVIGYKDESFRFRVNIFFARFQADDCNIREVHQEEAVIRRGTQEGRDEIHDNVLCSRTAPLPWVSVLSAFIFIIGLNIRGGRLIIVRQ
jgi:hypothetical protein